MSKSKRILSLILCLVMLLGALPMTAAADEPTVTASGYCGAEGDGSNLTWTLYGNGKLVISGSGEMYKMYSSVSSSPWYMYRDSITSVSIGSGVTSIGNFAFEDCTGLTKVIIPGSVTDMASGIFKGCTGLTTAGPIGGDYNIQFGWTDSIPDFAFWNDNCLEEVAIPETVKSIGYNAFDCCTNLTVVTIPSSVTSISGMALRNSISAYFKGNAPTVTAASETGATFGTETTLYYISGTTGWTDSTYYNADAGTWNGYKLATWELPKDDKPLTPGGSSLIYGSVISTVASKKGSSASTGSAAGADTQQTTDITVADMVDSYDQDYQTFSDVAKTDWFYSDVTSLTTKDVVSGYPDGTFRPYGEVTWGEALKLVLKAVGYECAATSNHWASGYMDKAIELGFIPGEVDLNAAITRGEMADLVAAAMKLGDATIASPFADDAPASAVALYEAGIIKGSADNGQLLYRAESTITRAEISAIIWRMVKAR